MKFWLIIFIINVCTVVITSGQNRANIWELSYQPYVPNLYLDFNYQPLQIVDISRTLYFLNTNASICDTNGQILFYTNGQWIANRNNDSLKNCKKFNTGFLTDKYYDNDYGLATSQFAIAIPDPGNSDRYYLFHETADTITNKEFGYTDIQPLYLSYSIVDMNLDNGLGGIPSQQKNVHAINDTLGFGMITACKHSNGKDWWIIIHKYNTNAYYTILVSSSGVSDPMLQSIGSVIRPFGTNIETYDSDVDGQAKFSPDGNYYAFTEIGEKVHLFDFDRCTGLLSNYRQDTLPFFETSFNSPIGLSFSPNSKYLFVNTYWHLFQYDVTTSNFDSSRKDIARYDSSIDFLDVYFGYEQLAPDGKVYLSPWGSNYYYSVVNQPDSEGGLCDFNQRGLILPTHSIGVPNFPNYDLGSLAIYIADAGNDTTISKGQSVQLGIPVVAGAKYEWFPTTFLDNPNAALPIATPDTTTTYYLTITDTATLSSCNVRMDTVTVYVDIADGILHHQNFSKDFYRINPNPVHDWLNIVYSIKDNALFELYSQFGQMVGSINLYPYFKNRMLNVATLPAGLYEWRVLQYNKRSSSGKVIIE